MLRSGHDGRVSPTTTPAEAQPPTPSPPHGPSTHTPPSTGERIAAVGVGAAVGALLRAWVATRWPTAATGFPMATLLVNLGGCFVMGLVTPVLRRRHPLVGLVTTTGFLGGFTTFSGFAYDVHHLTRPEPDEMVVYLAATVVGCVVAAAVGMVVTERLTCPDAAPDGASR